jgi:hypothetical protein
METESTSTTSEHTSVLGSCGGADIPVYTSNHQPATDQAKLINILSRYNYMTTNYTGTALWVAMYAGCRPFYFKEPAVFVRKTDEKQTVARILYRHLFSPANADEHISNKTVLLNGAFGLDYRRSADELRSLLEEWGKDITIVPL